MGREFLDIWTINKNHILKLKVPRDSENHLLVQRRNLREKEAKAEHQSPRGWEGTVQEVRVQDDHHGLSVMNTMKHPKEGEVAQ